MTITKHQALNAIYSLSQAYEKALLAHYAESAGSAGVHLKHLDEKFRKAADELGFTVVDRRIDLDLIHEVLGDCAGYFEKRSDVVDGDYGVPEPNREMCLLELVNRTLRHIDGDKPAPKPEQDEQTLGFR
jgi:hypothetical protein